MNSATPTSSEPNDNTKTPTSTVKGPTNISANTTDTTSGSHAFATSAVPSTRTTMPAPTATSEANTSVSTPSSTAVIASSGSMTLPTTMNDSSTAPDMLNTTATPINDTSANNSNPSNSANATLNTTSSATPQQQQKKIDKEREMAELLVTMDNYTPIIPNAVIDYYLNKTGFDCDDARIKKLFALAAQKFVADIATDAFQFNKIRQAGSRSASKLNKEKKAVLTMDDLSSALKEYGVNVEKPDYYN